MVGLHYFYYNLNLTQFPDIVYYWFSMSSAFRLYNGCSLCPLPMLPMWLAKDPYDKLQKNTRDLNINFILLLHYSHSQTATMNMEQSRICGWHNAFGILIVGFIDYVKFMCSMLTWYCQPRTYLWIWTTWPAL
jgi:hypothetical protein